MNLIAPQPRWSINGVVLPRNPSNFAMRHDPSNATYVKMADGTQRRIVPPTMITAAQIEMDWIFADQRVAKAVLSSLNQAIMAANSAGALSKITLDQEAPLVQIWAYLETTGYQHSGNMTGLGSAADISLDQRPGQGGTRKDVMIQGRTDGPYLHSAYQVPNSEPSQSQVQQWFGGALGSNYYDGIPTWNGAAWNQSTPATATKTISNLGTAPWSPVVRLNGPFNNGLTLKVAYQDVDGTGAGVVLTYTGANVNNGDYLLFDTQKMRLTSSVSGAINEIYTFTVTAVSSGLPFPYWPPAPPGNFSFTVTLAGGGGNTSVDYSNNGAETFRYYS